MITATIHEAKTHLSRLIAKVLEGEEVVVSRGKEPVVKIVPVKPVAPKRRTPGRLAHQVPKGCTDILAHGFWDPLSEEEAGLASEIDP